MATHRERLAQVMAYESCQRVPNYELGVWGQTAARWEREGMPAFTLHGDWFTGQEYFGLDHREFIPIDFGLRPPFQAKVLERTDRYEVIQRADGRVTKALIEGQERGTRASMDQYLRFPVECMADWRAMKQRLEADLPNRYPPYWRDSVAGWRGREHVLVAGRNCAAAGFYWRARDYMGTEGVSYGWYDQPDLMHDMMAFFADYTMEVLRPVLEAVDVDYFGYNEDMAMKTGPLLSPETFRTFIFPHLKRLNEFLRAHGVQQIWLDTDGNAEVLVPMLMDAGVDLIWPLERAADMDPHRLRRTFGTDLRLHGGVDKRELAKGRDAIRAHLKDLIPLVEQGGFIPSVDHTVPPDVSWDDFCYYMEMKAALLELDTSKF